MWEVKRMNTARIVVLVLAVGAGGVAAYLASGTDRKPELAPVAAQMDTVDVLVAKNDLPLGQSITADDMQWQSWPAGTVSAAFIQRKNSPNAVTEFTGSIVRSTFFAGEPIRDAKLVKANGSGFMAAILPTGMRAVSTEVSPETGAGGFILPNDRVDVLLTTRDRNNDRKTGETVNSEVVLSNVRVLAIDQTIEEKNGQKVVVGKTATLELKPEQTETLARARQSGTLSLALRSIADANAPQQQADENRKRRQDTINVVRYGVTTPTTTSK
jgi:pilus assembly protein CpaB